MKEIIKIGFFEFSKIIKNKKKLLYLFLMFLVVLLAALTFKESISLRLKSRPSDSSDSSAEYLSCRDYNKICYEYASGINTDLPEGYLMPHVYESEKFYYYEYLRYEYYLNSNTKRYDYVDLEFIDDSYSGNESGVFLVWSGNILFYIIVLLGIVLSLNAFALDLDNGNIKNIMQTKIKRKSIVLGKSLYLFLSISFLILLFSLVFILVAGFKSNNYVLLIKDDFVKAVDTRIYFISKMIINYSYGLLIAVITLVFRCLFNKTYLSGFLSVSLILFFIMVYNVAAYTVSSEIVKEEISKYFLFVNSQIKSISLYQSSFYLVLGFNFAFCIVLSLFVYKTNKKIEM